MTTSSVCTGFRAIFPPQLSTLPAAFSRSVAGLAATAAGARPLPAAREADPALTCRIEVRPGGDRDTEILSPGLDRELPGGSLFRLIIGAPAGYLYLVHRWETAAKPEQFWIINPPAIANGTRQEARTGWLGFDTGSGVEFIDLIWSARPLPGFPGTSRCEPVPADDPAAVKAVLDRPNGASKLRIRLTQGNHPRG